MCLNAPLRKWRLGKFWGFAQNYRIEGDSTASKVAKTTEEELGLQ